MREILFRGKDWLGHWHIGSIVHKVCENNTATSYYANSGMCNHIIKAGDYYIIDESGEGFWVSPDTIGEYTGLTDKSGTRIFEGDIVVWDYDEADLDGSTHTTPELVKWNNHCCGFAIDDYTTIDGECRVIGNIYDNPELLKGGKNN